MKEIEIEETDNIKACYRAISSFFDVFDLPSAKTDIVNSLLAANSNKLWKGKCPADIVFFYEEFQHLINAVTAIANCGCTRQTAIVIHENEKDIPDVNEYKLYCHLWEKKECWHYIPQYLSVKEFYNPYKALKKAVRYINEDEFDGLFERIIQYALSYDSFMDASLEWDTLKLNIMLQKLTEAAYLLHVRTYTKQDSLISALENMEQTNETANAEQQ